MRQAAALAVLAAMIAACGEPGATRYQGTPPPEAVAFGDCAFCHRGEALAVLPVAAELTCTTCHADARAGSVGPGHRARPPATLVPSFPASGHNLATLVPYGSCAYCHASTGLALSTSAPELRCEQCHTTALAASYGRGHRSLPGAKLVPSPSSAPHSTGSLAPWGTCALCHATIAASLAQTFGATDATACLTCHDEKPGVPFGPSHASRPGGSRVPSPAASPHRPEAEASWGECVLCHNRDARSLESLLGPPDEFSCLTCHVPGSVATFGPGHRLRPPSALVPDPPPLPHAPTASRSLATCALCHQSLAAAVAPVAAALTCEVCHSPSTPGTFGPGHRALPSPSLVPAFLGPSHELGQLSTFGSCAFCHRDRADALAWSGAAALGCTLCHRQEQAPFGPGHRSLPGPERVPSFIGPPHADATLRPFGSCALCHRNRTEQFLSFAHGELFIECSRCHAAHDTIAYGPGHATTVACVECHGTERRTHRDPASDSDSECAVCHDPHGSDNLFLIVRTLRAPAETLAPICFNSLAGLGAGSFASPNPPGTGLCEVCHTQTRFYRADGSGAPHFTFPCFTCHPHALGFSVRP